MERARVNGIDIAWRETGAGEPPLVAVPQWFLSSASMAVSPLVEVLATHHRTILYDRRGTGESSKPGPPYTSARDAKDLIQLLEALRLEPVVLLGLGVRGSHVALHVAGHAPERVAALVCIGGTPRWSASPEWPYGIQTGTFHKAFTVADPSKPPGAMPDDERLAAAMRGDWATTGAETANDILQRTLDDDVRTLLPRIVAPALVVHLRGDTLVSFDAARWLADSLRGGELEVFEAPRGLPLRAPEELAKHIEEFLSVSLG